jgi:glycosyltransferase involved in cell wall biosynthesis
MITNSKSDLPIVSVWMVTYNHESFIKQSIESVLEQKTNFPFEIIIGEDCSTDGTRKIIKQLELQYPNIIKPIYHEKNVGANRNAYEYCLPKLRGKYIACLEGDDFWTDPHKLQKQVDFLEKNPDVVLSFHNVNVINENNNRFIPGKSNKEPKYYGWKDIFHIHVPTLSVVFRNVLSNFPTDVFKVYNADAFLFGYLSSYGSAANLGFIGATYRQHAGGIYTKNKTIENQLLVLKSRYTMLNSRSFNTDQKAEIRAEIWRRKKMYAKNYLKHFAFTRAIKVLTVY